MQREVAIANVRHLFHNICMIDTCNENRFHLALNWVRDNLKNQQITLTPLSGDASTRHYYRIRGHREPLILMDSPLAQDKLSYYVDIARDWHKYKLRVPEILAVDLDQGWLIQTDFGDRHLLDQLKQGDISECYLPAMATVMSIQITDPLKNTPIYDGIMLQQELDLFSEWFCGTHLKAPLTLTEQASFAKLCTRLVTQAQAQPQVLVHRDFHSRNLMPQPNDKMGIIDFQDAVVGPFTYDLVSLLRDAYFECPEHMTYVFFDQYCTMAFEIGLLKRDHMFHTTEWFDLMGLQRHLKILGIFARLHHRDGKSTYLQHFPHLLRMISRACIKYTEFKPILDILKNRNMA